MKVKKRIITFFVMISLLASCSSEPSESIISPTPILLPVSTGSPEPDPEPTSVPPQVEPEITVTPEPEPEPVPVTEIPTAVPEPTTIPLPNNSCMYMNYSNSFPLSVTDSAEVLFGYDDLITIIAADGDQTQFHLSEQLVVDGIDISNADSWYFCGALQVHEFVYAHYDYLNGQTAVPSFLLRIDISEKTINSCIVSQNPRKHFSDSFTIFNDRIYYTKTTYSSGGTVTTNIISVNLDGADSQIVFEGTPGEYIPYLTADEKLLYFALTDSNSAGSLCAIDPTDNSKITLASGLKMMDFLVAINGYVMISTQSNTLTYYCPSDAAMHTIDLSTDSKLTAGHPMTDGTSIYIPLINYNSNAATCLLPVDLANNTAGTLIVLSENYYHLIGMINQFLYAENIDEFIVFDITDENF
ncbi:MAG: hypothetical protein K2N94_11595 [Lachnospiraceae bacterium]|nr:hypothetical protein [Lachnospiraceae bacterium]